VLASYTGGFRVESGSLRVSARGARNPLLLAFLSAALAWALAPAGGRRPALTADLASLGIAVPAWLRTPRAATLVAAIATGAVVLVGLFENSGTVGASDAYGYVSQARMFTEGRLEIAEPLMPRLADHDRRAFAPLGWSPDPDRPISLPTYPQGLPLLMSVFERAGGPGAVFLVVPLLAGIGVWSTFVLGRALAGPMVGAAGALLLASSPAFLYQVTTWPMSDVPATAWWTLCLALLAGGHGWPRASAAGLAAGAAILTRPNLAPVALAPLLLLLWPLVSARGGPSGPPSGRRSIASLAAFAPGATAGALAVAWFNAHWFGTPLSSGYGSLETLFSWSFLWPNLRNFSTWLAETQTPLFALALAGPWLARDLAAGSPSRLPVTAASATLAAIVVGSYLFYFPFPPWWNLRFIMPAFPVLLVFLAVALAALARRWHGDHGAMVAAALVLALSAHGVSAARERSAFETVAERRFADVGRYVRERLPKTAVVLAVLHSGSIRLYADRPTVRWDWIAPGEIDTLVGELRQLGLEPYLVLEEDERAPFRKAFAGTRTITRLEAPPLAELSLYKVRVFDLPAAAPTR
jgi:hypothetical protein